MCLNGQHQWTMSRWAALPSRYGTVLFALSMIRIECGTDEVNGTSVLPGLGAKGLFFNDIAKEGSEVVLEVTFLFPVWTSLDKHCSFRVPFPCLTVLGRHP
jgi:hypothetical protein